MRAELEKYFRDFVYNADFLELGIARKSGLTAGLLWLDNRIEKG